MKARTRKRSRNGAMLITMAESIGSTLGTIAGKADAAQRTLIPSSVLIAVEREGRKFLRKSRSLARKTSGKSKRAAAPTPANRKLAKSARRGIPRRTARAR
ncbi:MAG: hypothetical protein ACRD4K_03925 [Candidatus Acidiferrales bacterium]